MTDLHKIIQESAENDFGFSISFRAEYSGRGMYGRNCCAIVGDSLQELFTALVWSIETNKCEDELVSEILYQLNPTFDSMGTGYVMYFPGVESP